MGWILDRLRRDGLEQNTVVFFFADNGRRELRGIHWCYDSGLHVPLVIRWPGPLPTGSAAAWSRMYCAATATLLPLLRFSPLPGFDRSRTNRKMQLCCVRFPRHLGHQ